MPDYFPDQGPDMKLRWLAAQFEVLDNKPDADDILTIEEAADEIARLAKENWQLKQALGYPIPAEHDTPQNPFKCGACDARAQST